MSFNLLGILEDDVDHYISRDVLDWVKNDNRAFAVKTGLKVNIKAAKLMVSAVSRSYQTLDGEFEIYFREHEQIEIRANGNSTTYK